MFSRHNNIVDIHVFLSATILIYGEKSSLEHIPLTSLLLNVWHQPQVLQVVCFIGYAYQSHIVMPCAVSTVHAQPPSVEKGHRVIISIHVCTSFS